MQTKSSLKRQYIIYDETSSQENIEDILLRRFEDPSILEKSLEDLYDPYLLKDMDKAIERLKRAKENNEKVIIF